MQSGDVIGKDRRGVGIRKGGQHMDISCALEPFACVADACCTAL